MNLQLTLLLAYDVFPVILQNLRPSGVLFNKETVCEKFQIAREKVVTCHYRHIQSCACGRKLFHVCLFQLEVAREFFHSLLVDIFLHSHRFSSTFYVQTKRI